MAEKNEMLETNVLLELLDPNCNEKGLTPAAINYKNDLKKYQARTLSKPYDKERSPVYYQYISKPSCSFRTTWPANSNSRILAE
jgi:hypothetical protein